MYLQNIPGPLKWLIIVITVVIFLYITIVERARLRIDRQILVLPKLTSPDKHLRILHVSDLHMNGQSPFRRWRLQRYARRIKRMEYDVVVHTGDMLDNETGIEPAIAFLKDIAGERPAFTILGNHDYHHYSWFENIMNIHTLRRIGLPVKIPIAGYLGRLAEHTQESGIISLHNEGRLISENNTAVWLAGIDDLMLGEPNINRALSGAPQDAPIILLSHNPDIYPWAVLAGVDLVLSGHTHGGQINLPGIGPILTRCHIGRDKAAGLTLLGNSALHVSQGLGETLPIRLNSPHHATIIELRGRF